MQTNRRQQSGTRILSLIGLVIGLLALAACQPIRDPSVIAAEATAQASGTPAATAVPTGEAAAEEEASAVAPATATISADSLRVRAEPSDDAEVVAGARAGESYSVVGISSDGAWIQIEIDRSPSGTGWVSAGFVTLEGDITNIATVEVEAGESITTEVGTEEATAEATEEATAEATEEATAEVTEEATEEPAEEATPEATSEATTEATAEPTEEATEEPAAEATPEATEEATAEATEEATEEPAEEATAEATAEATEEPTAEATEEVADAGLGTVTIVSDLPLRVRSAPTTDEENKVGNVLDGEVYTVLEVSEDGQWVRIDVPDLVEGGGWVSAEFVVFNDAG